MYSLVFSSSARLPDHVLTVLNQHRLLRKPRSVNPYRFLPLFTLSLEEWKRARSLLSFPLRFQLECLVSSGVVSEEQITPQCTALLKGMRDASALQVRQGLCSNPSTTCVTLATPTP